MRVILTNPHASDGCDYRYSLTVGKEYEVIGLTTDSYHLLDDQHEPIFYSPECFTVTDWSIPSFWVWEFDDEGSFGASPPEWSTPGFFCDWHDSVPDVLKVFWDWFPKYYPWTAKSLGRPRPRTFGALEVEGENQVPS